MDDGADAGGSSPSIFMAVLTPASQFVCFESLFSVSYQRSTQNSSPPTARAFPRKRKMTFFFILITNLGKWVGHLVGIILKILNLLL